jgi:hypothetical protein
MMPLLTVAQAADHRGTTKFSIHRWLRSGLRHQRIGHAILIESRDLDRFKPRPAGNPTFGRHTPAKH